MVSAASLLHSGPHSGAWGQWGPWSTSAPPPGQAGAPWLMEVCTCQQVGSRWVQWWYRSLPLLAHGRKWNQSPTRRASPPSPVRFNPVIPWCWMAAPMRRSRHSLACSNNMPSWIYLSWSAASSQSPCAPPPGWTAPAQNPVHPIFIESQWQAWVGLGVGGTAIAAPCAGSWRHGGFFRKS